MSSSLLQTRLSPTSNIREKSQNQQTYNQSTSMLYVIDNAMLPFLYLSVYEFYQLLSFPVI